MQTIHYNRDASLRILHFSPHAKAFESLFGSVTCLPGCFTLYRLRTLDTHKPLLISNQMATDYSENRVDTLHLRNLPHLGQDRYLTTLFLKHFPSLCATRGCFSMRFVVMIDRLSMLTRLRAYWLFCDMLDWMLTLMNRSCI